MRPHLLSFEGNGLVLSGGRLCVENMTGLFVWFNSDGMAGFVRSEGAADGGEGTRGDFGAASAAVEAAPPETQSDVWQRHSISYWHNALWQGEAAYRFDERINASDLFESQAFGILFGASSFWWPGFTHVRARFDRFDLTRDTMRSDTSAFSDLDLTGDTMRLATSAFSDLDHGI